MSNKKKTTSEVLELAKNFLFDNRRYVPSYATVGDRLDHVYAQFRTSFYVEVDIDVQVRMTRTPSGTVPSFVVTVQAPALTKGVAEAQAFATLISRATELALQLQTYLDDVGRGAVWDSQAEEPANDETSAPKAEEPKAARKTKTPNTIIRPRKP
jgi:hypothetical protein